MFKRQKPAIQADTKADELALKLKETEKEHRKLNVEAGELANSFGKNYMKYLFETIEKHAYINGKYYIQVISKHLPSAAHRGQQHFFFARSSKPRMEHTHDVWSFDNRRRHLRLEWSLPHTYEMKNFLKSPELYDKKYIADIRLFLKLNKIDLSKLGGVAV